MAKNIRYLRFTFGVIQRINDEVEGVDFKSLLDNLEDDEKLLQVVQIALEENGIKSKEEAARLAKTFTRGEVIDRYIEDAHGDTLSKKLGALGNE